MQFPIAGEVTVNAFDLQTHRSVSGLRVGLEGPMPFVCDVPVSNLEPNTTYRIELKFDGEPVTLPGPDFVVSTAPSPGEEAAFYWLINKVPAEMALSLKYRYVPQWRFKFENKYAELEPLFKQNVTDRKPFTDLGGGFHFTNSFDFTGTTGKEPDPSIDVLIADGLASDAATAGSYLATRSDAQIAAYLRGKTPAELFKQLLEHLPHAPAGRNAQDTHHVLAINGKIGQFTRYDIAGRYLKVEFGFTDNAPLPAVITHTEQTATRIGYNPKTILEELRQFETGLKKIPSVVNSMNLKQNVKDQFLNYLK